MKNNRNECLIKKSICLTAILAALLLNAGCENVFKAFTMQKYKSKSEIKQEELAKKDSTRELDKLKPRFMFEDDEKFFKNYLIAKEEFFLLDKYSYIGSAAVSNFEIDKDGNFLLYDKASGALLVFNRYGTLTEKIKLNFGSESRILAPTNMLTDIDGNIIMMCGILGRYYRFARTGTLLNSGDVAESDTDNKVKLSFALKMFSFGDYRIYADLYSKNVYFYRDGKRLFYFNYEGMSEDSYFYVSPASEFYLVDPPNYTIFNVIPVDDGDPKQPYKCRLVKYAGNKILKNSSGETFIFKKNVRIVEKLNKKGETVSQYGVTNAGNVTFANNLYPADFALDSDDNLYILDDKNFKVNVYNKAGVFSFSFGSYGKRMGKFLAPTHIVVDKLRRIIITDGERNEAMVFSANGEYLENYGDVLGVNALANYGIYVDLHEKIHIFDYPSNEHYSIPYEFQLLKLLNEFLAAKNNYPQNYITIDKTANINFFDFNGQRNIEITPLAHVKAVPAPEEISSKKVEPPKICIKSICDDGVGNVLGLSKTSPVVYKMNITGRMLKRFQIPKSGQFYSTVAADMFRNFYVADGAEKRLTKFDENGKIKGALDIPAVPAPKKISKIEFSKKNMAFLADYESGKIFVLNTLNGMSVDSVCEAAASKEWKITPLDIKARDDNFYVLGSANGNLIFLKYKVSDYYKEAVHLFSQGLYQEALASFEKYLRLNVSNPNALYYMSQCHRKLGNSYEAALLEAELIKKYPSSLAAKKVN